MNEAERWVEARRWLCYADEDLSTAKMLIRRQCVPRQVCWLAQQGAEKAIKSVLVFLQEDFPRRHDLDALRNLIPEGWMVKTANPDLAELTEWAVEARYPGNWPEATVADAESAVAQARNVYRCVCEDFIRLGYSVKEERQD